MAQRDLSARDLATATDAEFALMDAGPDAIVAFLEGLRAEVGSPQDRPPAQYGRMYDWMARGHGANAAFSPLWDLLRKHILDNWPLDEGELALDYRLPARRLHSIRSASQAHDLHPKRLRRLLVDAGTIAEGDTLDCDVLFSAPEARELLEQASGSVSFAEAQRRLGMTRTQMERLSIDGLLPPGEGGEKARPRFTESTIREWADFFDVFPQASQYHTLSSLSESVGSLGVSTAEILRMIKDGRLSEVHRDSAKDGLAALLIRKDAAARHLRTAAGQQTSTAISSVSSR